MTLTEAIEQKDKRINGLKADECVFVGITRESNQIWYLEFLPDNTYRWCNRFAPMAINPQMFDMSNIFREVTQEDLDAEDFKLYEVDWSDW